MTLFQKETKKAIFFFGKHNNLQLDLDVSEDELDKRAIIIIEDFKRLMEFLNLHETFPVCDDEIFMITSYFFWDETQSKKQQFLLKMIVKMLKCQGRKKGRGWKVISEG